MAKIKVDKHNARLHPERNQQAAEKSLDQLGAGRSVLADQEGVMIGGNLIYEKALKLGIPIEQVHTKGDKLIVVVRDDLKTNDPRRKALALADNKINDLSEFDFEIVAEIFNEIKDIDLELTGFSPSEIEMMLDADFHPGEVTGEEFEPGKAKTVVCPKCGHEFEV